MAAAQEAQGEMPDAQGNQGPPEFFRSIYPEHAFDEAMALYGALGNEEAELDAKTRELVALAVAAQIPCEYCVYAHMKNARSAGATEGELREAVATAANVRMWSTMLNGMDYDFEAFRAEHDELMPPTN
ncbi:MAG: carboxymuconolactone decarboxylase family protein [Limimaricola sp.]